MRLPQLSSDLAFFEKEIKNKLRFKHAIKSSVIASNGGNMGSDIASNSEPLVNANGQANSNFEDYKVHSESLCNFDSCTSFQDKGIHYSETRANLNGCNSGIGPDENVGVQISTINTDLDSTSFSTGCNQSYCPNNDYGYNYNCTYSTNYNFDHTDYSLSSVPRTITVLNNNVLNGYNSEPTSNQGLFDMNFDDHLDYDYIDNISTVANPHYNDCLHYSYNKNNSLIHNTAFIQSFSSLNSSLDAGSSPPISRSSSPLKPLGLNCGYSGIDSILSNSFQKSQTQISNIKKRKIESNPDFLPTPFSFDFKMNLLAFTNDETLTHYSFQLSPFSEDRLKLIKSLASKEYLDNTSVDSILNLYTSQNLKIKLKILRKIINLSGDSILINHSNLEKSWLLQIKLTDINNILDSNKSEASHFQLYKYLMIDFIIMLSLVDSTIAYIVHNYHASFAPLLYPQSEEEILTKFLISMDTNTINEIRAHCHLDSFDSDLLNRLAYLLWKTEDPSVCNQFRQIFQ